MRIGEEVVKISEECVRIGEVRIMKRERMICSWRAEGQVLVVAADQPREPSLTRVVSH